jgi:hypothetical protein
MARSHRPKNAAVPVRDLTGTGVQSPCPGFAAGPDIADCLRPLEKSAELLASCTYPSERCVANLRTSCGKVGETQRIVPQVEELHR